MRTLLTDTTAWTGVRPAPVAGWILVEHDRIAATGSAAVPAPDADERIALPGHHVLPGLTDCHSHLSVGCWLPEALDGSAWRSREEALEAVRATAAAAPAGAWLLGAGFDHTGWRDPRPPRCDELEAAAPGRKILLAHVSLHTGALSASGMVAVARAAPDFVRLPDVERDRRGRPTGTVWEGAFGRAVFTLARDLTAQRGTAGVEDLLVAEAARHLRLGLTRVHDAGVPVHVHAQMEAAAARTPLRLSWSITGTAGLLEPPPPARALPSGPYGETGRQVKLFLDGAQRCAVSLPLGALPRMLGATVAAAQRERSFGPIRTALGRKLRVSRSGVVLPYLRHTDADLQPLVASWVAAGVRIRIHALGNEAVAQAARLLRWAGAPAGTTSIEHAMFLRPRERDALATSGAVASVQPGFIPHYAEQVRASGVQGALAVLGLRDLVDAGAPVAISSDHPCGPLDPLHNLRRAVDRSVGDGTHLQPAQALSGSEAVRALTAGGAEALGIPAEQATIVPGAPADLAVCDGDPFAPATRVVQTWVAGRPVV